MTEDADSLRSAIDGIYRNESRRVLAALIRLLGDFDLAEEATHDAFRAAFDSWGTHGVPAHPRAWLVSTGRFQAIDALRRRARFDASLSDIAERLYAESVEQPITDDELIDDDRLRLVFMCCHPALPPDAQVALTLREVCGLTTEDIAQAFLCTPPTIAQRIVRAKGKIRDARIPYEIPSRADLPERLYAVLRVVYLVFNEGYSASSGDVVTRVAFSTEAIRLGRLVAELMPVSEAIGLVSLMLLHESRRRARVSGDGELVLLGEQDRLLWDRALIEEGTALAERALRSGPAGTYAIQAAIAAVHAESAHTGETDWPQIIGLYDVLMNVDPSPIVELNRAAAVSMVHGPDASLEMLDVLMERGELDDFHLAHSARADALRRLGRRDESRAAYLRALALARQEPERRFLRRRIAELH